MSLACLISAIVGEMMIVSTAFEEERVKAQYCAVPRGQRLIIHELIAGVGLWQHVLCWCFFAA